MAVAALNSSGRAATKTTIFLATGDWLLIVFGWMFAVICGVYVAGGVTGAHINPAVTVANAVKRGFPWGKVPGYILAQVAGAFVAAAVVFWVYHNAIDTYLVNTHAVKKTSLATYSIFATFPAPYYHNIGGPFLDEAVGTFLLVLVVFAISDEFNIAPQANMGPLIVGVIVAAVGASFGANTGYAINPARDFGPRLFAWIAGWGKLALPGNYKSHSPRERQYQCLLLDTDYRAYCGRHNRRRCLRLLHQRHPDRSGQCPGRTTSDGGGQSGPRRTASRLGRRVLA